MSLPFTCEKNIMGEISLIIDEEVFKISKDLLCQHSDYFRAMFSGNYKENTQDKIKIDVVDATSMTLIIQYMENGLIDLKKIPLDDLAVSANFLQMTEFMKQIEYTLQNSLTYTNWLKTMAIAEAISSLKLEQSAVAYGLFSFKSMKPEHIPTIQSLHWYLSHTYLNIDNELQVFKFGYDWVKLHELSADALLVVLGCLDITAVKKRQLKEIKDLLNNFENSLPTKMVECLFHILDIYKEINVDITVRSKQNLIELFTESVVTEVQNLIKYNCKRMLQTIPCVPVAHESNVGCYSKTNENSTPQESCCIHNRNSNNSQYIYKFQEGRGLEHLLSVGNTPLWGWNVTNWGLTKLIVVCGEYRKGSGLFNRDVAVYDTLTKQWDKHGVVLPPRRHAGVTTIGKSLYIAGGVGSFRLVLTTCIIYDLEDHSTVKIADIPDPLQNPAVCAHEGRVYLSSLQNVYRYETNGETDRWQLILTTNIRANYLLSYDNYIYFTQYYYNQLYRFQPDKDKDLDNITAFENAVSCICLADRKIIAFTHSLVSNDQQFVETYEEGKTSTTMLWKYDESSFKIYDAAGCCALVLSAPPKNCMHSVYANKYLKLFPETETLIENCSTINYEN